MCYDCELIDFGIDKYVHKLKLYLFHCSFKCKSLVLCLSPRVNLPLFNVVY